MKVASRKNRTEKKVDKYANPLQDVEIDTSLDEEDDDNFVGKSKEKSKKKIKNETEEEIEKEKVKKNKRKKKTDEEEDEEEEKEVLTIIYDKKSFQKYYENLKNQIMGNFTSLDVVEKEYPLPPNKKLFSKFTFFTQMGISLLIFGGQKIKDKVPMIPSNVFDMIEKNKWVIMIGNFIGHQYLNKMLSTTGAFEVYYKNRNIYSKLATNRLPSELDIHKQLKNLVKKGKKKAKSSEDEEADEDL